MKWIGQHIWSFISRFRNKVYLEDIEEVTQEHSVMVGPDGILTKSIHPSERSRLQVRNNEGATIPLGSPLYSKGEIGGSERLLVGICDADDPSKMPCIGIAEVEMNTTSTKDNFAITQGVYNGNIHGFTGLSVSDILYVQDDGSLNQSKPTGQDSKVQNVGVVLKTNGTICQGLLVSAIGRANDTPNLDNGYIFLGNSSNVSQTTTVAAAIEGAGNITIDGNVTIGANEVGHDFKLYGDTSLASVLWDSTYDFLKFGDLTKIVFGSGQAAADFDSSIQADGSNLVIYNDTGNIQIGDTVEITGDLDITGDFKVSGNDIKNSNDSTCITFGTTADNIVNINNQLRVGASGTDNGVDAYFYSDDASKYMWWEHDFASLHLEDNTKIVFGSGVVSYSSDSQIYADGSDLKIENSEGNIKIGDTVEITGDLDVDGTITATKIESATQFSHEGDANTGLEFSSDTVTIEANNENVAVFSSNAITFGEALSMGSDGDGKSLILYGSTSGVKIAWSAYGNGLLINDNTRVNFGTPSGGPSGDVYFNFDGTKLQLAPTATNGDNIFEISKPGTGTTSLNLQGDLTVDGDIAAGGNLTGVTNFIDVKTAAYWSSSTSAIYVPISGATTSESTSLSAASYTTMFVVPFGGKVTRITSWNQGTGTPAVSTFELYVNGDDDPLSDQVGTDLVLTSYNNSMVGDCASDWVFTKGQTIAIRRTDSTALYGVTMSVVLEYDTTT